MRGRLVGGTGMLVGAMSGGPAVAFGTPTPSFPVNSFGSRFTSFWADLFPVGLSTWTIGELPIELLSIVLAIAMAALVVFLLGRTVTSPVPLLSALEALIIRLGGPSGSFLLLNQRVNLGNHSWVN